jgi:hypothetical protein
MKTVRGFDLRSILLVTLLLAALACANRASAQSYLVDLESRTATALGRWGVSAINDAAQVVGGSGGICLHHRAGWRRNEKLG